MLHRSYQRTDTPREVFTRASRCARLGARHGGPSFRPELVRPIQYRYETGAVVDDFHFLEALIDIAPALAVALVIRWVYARKREQSRVISFWIIPIVAVLQLGVIAVRGVTGV